MDWEKPLGAWDVTSMHRVRRSISWEEAVMKPSLNPGARILENESRRITRPSVSRLKNEGMRLDKSSFPVMEVDLVISPVYGSICKKSTPSDLNHKP